MGARGAVIQACVLAPGHRTRRGSAGGDTGRSEEACIDDDLEILDRAALIAEVKKLRAGIRAHRDSSGHDLCWHHPQLWGLLPEPIPAEIAVPPWPRFLRGCVKYRESLDRELPNAPVHDAELE